MNKPITVASQDFCNDLVSLCNNSGLPAFIMAEYVAKLHAELEKLATQQYEADKKAYEEADDNDTHEENVH